MSALEQAQSALDTLIEAARTGAIIPVRLTGQLEELKELLAQAEETEAEQSQTVTGDAGKILADDAEFIDKAVHQLRVPVTSIRGYSDMLNDHALTGNFNEMQDQLLQVIRTNSKQMESLLTDISYVSRIRAGTLDISENMDIFKNIAQMAEKAIRPLAEELNRQLEFDIPQGLPLLMTDGELMAQALIKLIENGLRYSAEGTGKVVVSGRGENDLLIITIKDNGIGMKAEEIARLGEWYYRGNHDLVLAHKGSGLGVPIAFGLVKALKGTTDVTSEPETGTTITLTFKGLT